MEQEKKHTPLQILITGAASGIGMELAKNYLKDGHTVHIILKNASGQHGEVFQSFKNKVFFYICDISCSKQIESLKKDVLANTDYLDVLINNAGYATYELFEEMSFKEVINLSYVNFVGHIGVTKIFLEMLKMSDKPHIVFIASIAAELPITPNSVYSASKSGLQKLGNVLRLELSHLNFAVTNVFPGRLETPFFNHPTFKSRNAGKEILFTTNVEKSCRIMYAKIKKRKKEVYVPNYWRFFSYLYCLDRVISSKIFDRLIKNRILRIINERIQKW